MIQTLIMGWLVGSYIVAAYNAQQDHNDKMERMEECRVKFNMNDRDIEFTSAEQAEFDKATADGKHRIYNKVLNEYDPRIETIDKEIATLKAILPLVARMQEEHDAGQYRKAAVDTMNLIRKLLDKPEHKGLRFWWWKDRRLDGYAKYAKKTNYKEAMTGEIYSAKCDIGFKIKELEEVRAAEHRRT